jgi:hypothetical protein
MDLSKLKAPFPQSQVSWRAQTVSKNGDKALALAYIDARDVQDRLDEVCGPENWQCRYPHANGKTVCEIGIRVNGEWVWKSDGAGDSDIEAEKGALSDAFKRAAVRWGVGRYLYDLETPWVPCESYEKGGKFHFSKFTADPWKHVRQRNAPPPQEPPAELTKEQRADAWIAKAQDHVKHKLPTRIEFVQWQNSEGYKKAVAAIKEDFPDKHTDFMAWLDDQFNSKPAGKAAA